MLEKLDDYWHPTLQLMGLLFPPGVKFANFMHLSLAVDGRSVS